MKSPYKIPLGTVFFSRESFMNSHRNSLLIIKKNLLGFFWKHSSEIFIKFAPGRPSEITQGILQEMLAWIASGISPWISSKSPPNSFWDAFRRFFSDYFRNQSQSCPQFLKGFIRKPSIDYYKIFSREFFFRNFSNELSMISHSNFF